MYGYQDSSDLGPGKQGGKFGLNTGAFITKFEYNPNSGKDGAEQDGLDLTVQVGEREYRHRFFPVGKVYASRKDGGAELTDTNSEAYKEAYKKEVELLSGTLTDIVKAFVPEEQIKQALATPINSFKDYAQILERLVKSVPNWNKVPVDVFLEYQWSPSGDNDRTFLTLPKNVKHGQFISKSYGPGFREERTSSSLKYVNEQGEEHPFKRNEWYLGSDFAKQTGVGTTETNSSEGGAMQSSGAAW